MFSKILRPSRFALERLIQQGLYAQLLLVVGLVVGVAVVGGLAAWAVTSQFEHPGVAMWWAFLRLTDPGYLGDDEGAALRIVSTVVTVVGYVLFMGTLIAIMTQWLSKTMRLLESGLTPIAMRDHIVILGWTNRTPELVRQLMGGEGRLRRFLAQTDVNRLRIVVQAEEVDAERRLELREHLGDLWNHNQVFMRSGSPLDLDDLRRLDLTRAAAVLVPGADFESGGADTSDTRVVKALLTLANLLKDVDHEDWPAVVAEIFDPQKAPLARSAFGGQAEVISSDRTVSRLLSQSVRHRDLAAVLFGLLSHRRGNSVYLRRYPEMDGNAPSTLFASFPTAVVIGALRVVDGVRVADLDPRSDEPLGAGDQVILLAQRYDDCTLEAAAPAARPQTPVAPAPRVDQDTSRILILGWSHKLGVLASELGCDSSTRFEITVMSRFSIEDRERWLERVAYDRDRVTIEHLDGDYALEADLRRVDLERFDHVALVASDWMATSDESDARTILGYVLLRSVLQTIDNPPEVLVELLDPDNQHLFDTDEDEYLVTPQILSYMLAHVALRPELSTAYEALFSTGGAEINLYPAEDLQLTGRPVTFRDIQQRVFDAGMTAIGLMSSEGEAELNPDRRATRTLASDDRVIVLATHE